MFEENENLVTDVTENVEQLTTEENVEEVEGVETTEQTDVGVDTEQPQPAVETFTKEQVDEMIAKKLARKEAKIRRELENKYSRLETVVNTGLGTSNIEEATEKLTNFYEKRGIVIPTEPRYSEREIELLANAEAEDIIDGGYDELVEEVDRLANIGVDNMTPREKIIFSKLASERQKVEDEKALASIGISRSAINDAEFKEFSNKLNPNLSLKEKYEMYLQLKPKKQIEKMGSMKSSQDSKIKDFYTPEEIERLTDEDLDNPQIWEAVRRSMTGQA